MLFCQSIDLVISIDNFYWLLLSKSPLSQSEALLDKSRSTLLECVLDEMIHLKIWTKSIGSSVQGQGQRKTPRTTWTFCGVPLALDVSWLPIKLFTATWNISQHTDVANYQSLLIKRFSVNEYNHCFHVYAFIISTNYVNYRAVWLPAFWRQGLYSRSEKMFLSSV